MVFNFHRSTTPVRFAEQLRTELGNLRALVPSLPHPLLEALHADARLRGARALPLTDGRGDTVNLCFL